MTADSLSADLAALRAAYGELLAGGAPLTHRVIVEGRRAAGLSVRAAAAAAGVSHAMWSRWELGRSEPPEPARKALGWPAAANKPRVTRTPTRAPLKPAEAKAAARAVRELDRFGIGSPGLLITIDDRVISVAPPDAVVTHRLCLVRLASERVRRGMATHTDHAILAANGDERILVLVLGKTLGRMRSQGLEDAVVWRVGAIAYVWATAGLPSARRCWANYPNARG
jgi:DNA-binding transcriptional regulator YiaG